jgi:hypothetical protein
MALRVVIYHGDFLAGFEFKYFRAPLTVPSFRGAGFSFVPFTAGPSARFQYHPTQKSITIITRKAANNPAASAAAFAPGSADFVPDGFYWDICSTIGTITFSSAGLSLALMAPLHRHQPEAARRA